MKMAIKLLMIMKMKIIKMIQYKLKNKIKKMRSLMIMEIKIINIMMKCKILKNIIIIIMKRL